MISVEYGWPTIRPYVSRWRPPTSWTGRAWMFNCLNTKQLIPPFKHPHLMTLQTGNLWAHHKGLQFLEQGATDPSSLHLLLKHCCSSCSGSYCMLLGPSSSSKHPPEDGKFNDVHLPLHLWVQDWFVSLGHCLIVWLVLYHWLPICFHVCQCRYFFVHFKEQTCIYSRTPITLTRI